MTVRFIGEVQGMTAFDRAFLKVENFLGDWTPIFEAAGDLFYEWMQDQFWQAGRAGETPWPDLSPAYQEYKDRVRPFSPLMRFDDVLYKSLTKRGGNEFNVHLIQKDEAAFGTSDPKARWHQEGVPGRLPARVLISITDLRRTQLMKRAQGEIVRQIRETGLIGREE